MTSIKRWAVASASVVCLLAKGAREAKRCTKKLQNKGVEGEQKVGEMVRTARRCGWYQEILSVCVCVWRRVVPGVEVWSTECLDGVPARSRQPGSITTSVWSWLNSGTGMEAWGSSGGLEIGHGLGWPGSLMGSWARGRGQKLHVRVGDWSLKVVVPKWWSQTVGTYNT